jgi:LysM repeat protein
LITSFPSLSALVADKQDSKNREGQLLSVGHFKPPHTVVKGDTVFDIVNKNGITMEAIILTNNLVVPIYEGQTLLIP